LNSQINSSTELQIPDLILELGDDDILKRQHARLLLVHHEPESIPALLDALNNSNTQIRWEAVRALGDIRAPKTATDLSEMLMDEDTGVRWAAMESLIKIGRNSLRPLLEKFTKDFESPWLREGVDHILHVLKDRQELNGKEIALFEKLDVQCIPGFESIWTSEQASAAEKALEALDKEAILSR